KPEPTGRAAQRPAHRAPRSAACATVLPCLRTCVDPRTVAMNGPPRLQCRRVSKRLPWGGGELSILQDIDLTLGDGESLAILGPSGSGKSTLLGLMAGLDRPSSGEVLIDGVSLSSLSEDGLALLRRQRVGFVFQSFQLLPNFTALENVLLPLE